jgi:hypothetical protein
MIVFHVKNDTLFRQKLANNRTSTLKVMRQVAPTSSTMAITDAADVV